jgi:gamma-glutamyltranspeptidase/glutathione hydrolase
VYRCRDSHYIWEKIAHGAVRQGKLAWVMRAFLLALCLLPSLGLNSSAHAADPPPVGATRGMVVTAQHIASNVGAMILAHGGNAIDAAVAVGYALAVVYPAAGNLGGGGFMTLRLADGHTDFLDYREKAPLAATRDMFLGPDGTVRPGASTRSWLAVGVPGSAAGLEAARLRYGTMSRAAVMAPAIALARNGFVLDGGDVSLLRIVAPRLASDPATAAIFLIGGAAPAIGSRLRQPQLAASLEAISRLGPQAALYDGPIGARIAAASKADGGILSVRDFAAYKVRWLAPIACDYRGYRVISAPPPSSGGISLCEMLDILGGYDLQAAGFHSAAEVHLLVEAMRRAFRDRNSDLGDPAFVHNPEARLLAPAYAAKLRVGIDPVRATPSASLGPAATAPAEQPQTTQFSVVDAAGNAVSVTTTLNGWFGIGRVAGDTGIVMNNEMDDFAAKPGSSNMFGLVQGEANAVAPGKTPLSSMTPTIMTRDGALKLVVGSPGGPRIITTVLEAIVNMVDHGMNVQQAIDAPRIHEQFLPDVVFTERFALSPDTQAILEHDGYRLRPSGTWSEAEAIAVGAPGFVAPSLPPGALPMPEPYRAGATLFGAHDVRGASGAARGVN